jgi:glycosyltransferase involved in cell wall biosynthesis
MNIHILTTSYPGHKEDFRGRFVHELGAALQQLGHHVTVTVPHPGHQSSAGQIMDGVTVTRTPVALFQNHASTVFGSTGVLESCRHHPWRVAELPFALAAWARRAWLSTPWPDLVISNWLVPSGLLGAKLAGKLGVPHICIEHGGGGRLLSAIPGGRHILASVLAGTTCLQTVSPALAHSIAELSRHRQPPVPMFSYPIPPPRVARQPNRSFSSPLRFLFIGRFTEGKGPLLLLNALADTGSVHATLAGGGPLLAAAQQLAAKKHMTQRVQFPGEIPYSQLPALYGEHDILVLPSQSGSSRLLPLAEGTPRVLLEGMTHGLVPLASQAGGIPAVIEHERNGLLFPAGDKATLSNFIRRLSKEPETCHRLSLGAIATAHEFSYSDLFDYWRKHGIAV